MVYQVNTSGKANTKKLQAIPETACHDAAKPNKGWLVFHKKKYLIAESMNEETPPGPMFSAKVINNTKLVYKSDDETDSDDEEVDVDDPKSLVDMLLDCWKRNGVKMADLPEIMRVAKLYHTTILSRPHLRF